MRLIRDGIVDREGVRAWPAARLQHAPAQPSHHRRGRHRPARPGTGPAQPDGTHPARDDRAPHRPRRLRRRLRQRAPVQRDGAPNLRRHAERPPGPGARRRPRARRAAAERRREGHPAPPALPADHSARRRCSSSSALARCPGSSRSTAPTYRRSLRLPHGHGGRRARRQRRQRPTTAPPTWRATALSDLRDLTTAVSRCRQLLDLDADPVAICEALGETRPRPARRGAIPGRRVPGRGGRLRAGRARRHRPTGLGAGARTVAGRLVRRPATRCPAPDGGVTHLFPTPAALVSSPSADPAAFAMPAGRRRALVALAEAVGRGRRRDRPGCRPARAAPIAWWPCPASGRGRPSTSPCARCGTLTRSCRPTSVSVGRAAAIGLPDDPARLSRPTEGWRPWRSYAMAHLWSLARGASRHASTDPTT